MKYVILLMIGMTIGCNLLIPDQWGEDFVFDIPEIGAIDEWQILRFVRFETTYISDDESHNRKDYWQTPDQTYNMKTGDCEDRVILAMYMIKQEIGIETQLLLIKLDDIYHALIEIDGKAYDIGGVYYRTVNDYRLIERMSYGDVMYRTATFHRAIAN